MALNLALIDIGLWGAGLIVAGTVVALRVADRTRLVNPPRTAEQKQEGTQ